MLEIATFTRKKQSAFNALLTSVAVIPRIRELALSLALAFLIILAKPNSTVANPENGVVVEGSATIVVSSPTQIDVYQETDRVAIDWNSFSISADEYTFFHQPSPDSIALNRINGGTISLIEGHLSANGLLFIVNPNGIAFAPSALVNVAGLVATTANIGNADFMAGRFDFDVPSADGAVLVSNHGELRVTDGGLIALVAPGVENAGAIYVRLGMVSMTLADTFTLDLYGDELVQLAVDSQTAHQIAQTGAGQNLTAELNQSGEIYAEGGVVTLSVQAAQGVLDSVINMSGVIQAQTALNDRGEIFLRGGEQGTVLVAGTLDASGRDPGETGGSVKVLGDKVGLIEGAVIDVAGDVGGGSALVGGNFQGLGPEPNAQHVFIGDEVAILADAVTAGDGGRVIVWADGNTVYHGAISARGGAEAGDGGFVEVSGKQYLAFRGSADTRAPQGETGTLLLDPLDLVITGGSGDGESDGTTTFQGAGTAGKIQANNALSVVYQSEIEAVSATTKINIEATRNITVSGTFDNSGKLVIGSGLEFKLKTQNTTGNAGGIDLTGSTHGADLEIVTAGIGSLKLEAASKNQAVGNITVGVLTAGSNILDLKTQNGKIFLNRDLSTDGGEVVFTASQGVFLNASITVDTDNTGGTSAAGDISFVTKNNNETTLEGATSGLTLTLDASADGGGLGGAVTVQRMGETQSLSGLTIDTSGGLGGAITLGVVGDSNTLTGGGPISVTGASITVNDIISTSGSLTFTALGGVTVSADVTSAGTTTIDADSDDDGSGDFTVSSSQTLSTTNNALSITANDMDLSGSLTSGSSTTTLLVSDGGTIVLGGSGGGLNLSNAELQSVTASRLTIGDGTAGAITVSSDVTPGSSSGSGVTTVSLVTGGAITGTAGGIIETNLALTASGTINVTDATTDVDTLAISAAGQTVTFTDADALDIGTVAGVAGITATTFNLNTSGAVTDTSALAVTGTATIAAGSGNDITLDVGTNDFATIGITSGNNVTLVDANALILAASTVSGTLSVTTSGAITDSGALAVTGATTLAAGSGNNITLDTGTNDFSTVGITSGNDVTLVDANALILAASTVSGTLSVTTSGAITDSGALAVAGATTLAAGSGNNITLDVGTNDFSTVGITTGNNVTLVDTNALILAASTVSGTLSVTTSGAITDSGALAVTGAMTLAAGSGNNITLDVGTNDFSTVGITSGNDVTLVDANALILAASTVSGTLDVTTSGTITDSGALAVTGATTLAAGSGNNITLDTGTNDFSTVGITSGNDVTLVDANALIFAASTVSGTLSVTTSGAITDSGALAVTGATTLAAGSGNNITLDVGTNDFATIGITSGNDVTLVDANALILAASTVSGTLSVTTSGAITDSGALAVTGATTLAAGSGNNITLDVGTNDFSTVGITSGNKVALVDANALILAASTVSGTLSVTTSGAITDSGALAVTGATTLAAGSGNNITLDTGTNNFSSVAITTGNNVTLVDTNAISLAASTISGTLDVTAVAGVTVSADVTSAGTTTIDADSDDDGSGDFTVSSSQTLSTTNNALSITANDMDLSGSLTSGSSTTTLLVSDGGTIVLGGSGGGLNLSNAELQSVTASRLTIGDGTAGAITVSSDVTPGSSSGSGVTTVSLVTGGAITGTAGGIIETNLALTASGTINVTDATTDVDTLAISAAGQTVTFTDANTLDIGTVAGVVGITATTFNLVNLTTTTVTQEQADTSVAVTAAIDTQIGDSLSTDGAEALLGSNSPLNPFNINPFGDLLLTAVPSTTPVPETFGAPASEPLSAPVRELPGEPVQEPSVEPGPDAPENAPTLEQEEEQEEGQTT